VEEFSRLKRLPAYVFNITTELKSAARRRGEDIIDFGMGNPDGATPQHIVDKMIEAAQKSNTHRYSLSRGIPRLRKAICNWYQRRYDVALDPDTEAIVTIGSKEGIAHLCLATLDQGDVVVVPNPSYPIHIYGPVIAGANIHSVAILTQRSMEEAAVEAIAAGTDLLEICKSPALVLRAYEALLSEAEHSPSFRRRIQQVARRVAYRKNQVLSAKVAAAPSSEVLKKIRVQVQNLAHEVLSTAPDKLRQT